MKRSLITPLIVVADDFYDDPDKVRNKALSQQYQQNDTPFMLKRYGEVNLAEAKRAIQRMGSLIGKELQEKFVVSNFLLQTKKDELNSEGWVHTDRHQRVGLVSLNTPQQCRGGTCFFRHKVTGVTRREQLADLPIKWVNRVMFEDSRDLSKWEVIVRINMVYNRLIIFDPKMFHQAAFYFGTSIQNGRLSQTFVFDEVPDSRRLKKKFKRILKIFKQDQKK